MSVGKKIISKLPKLDLSRTEDRLKLIILISGFILVFGSLTVGGVAFTMRSSFCSSCHEMLPEYRTWQASAHSNIGCVDCHIEPGITNLIKDKVGAVVQVYKHVTKSYDSPIEFPWDHKEIPNVVCLKCHSANRQYSLAGDIVVPHEKHIANHVECVECHKGVSHGLVAEREVSKASTIPFDQWTVSVGSEQMAPKFSKPKMETCVQCHLKKGVSTSCTKCHKEMSVPASHKDQTAWKVSHGVTARTDVNACDKCHSYGFTKPVEGKQLSVNQYARTNEFCLDCHTKRPANHGSKEDESWISGHKSVANAKGINNCLACHDLKEAQKPVEAKPAEGEAEDKHGENKASDQSRDQLVNKVYCSQCHGSKFRS